MFHRPTFQAFFFFYSFYSSQLSRDIQLPRPYLGVCPAASSASQQMKAVVWMQWAFTISPSFQTAALGSGATWAFSWKHSDAFSDVKEFDSFAFIHWGTILWEYNKFGLYTMARINRRILGERDQKGSRNIAGRVLPPLVAPACAPVGLPM